MMDRRGDSGGVPDSDNNWRREGADRRPAGFGRERGGDNDWPPRGGRDDGASDNRPRLKLQPRTKPLPDGHDAKPDAREEDEPRRMKADPFGGARPVSKTSDSQDVKGEDDSKQKWVSPSVRKRLAESASEDRKGIERESRKPDDKTTDADGWEEIKSVKPKSGSKYVPPSARQEEALREAEEKREAEAAEEARLAQKKERKEKKKQALEETKEKEQKAETKLKKEPKSTPVDNVKSDADASADRVTEFSTMCAKVVSDSEADVDGLVRQMHSVLTEAEWNTVAPIVELFKPLLEHCRRKSDAQIIAAVQRLAPLVTALIEKAQVHRFKVKVLCEAQLIAYNLGLPRLSPESALLEVFFDGLYQAKIVEEQYFHWWADASDDTPGKINSLFQVRSFLDWLQNAKVIGEPDSEEDEERDPDGESDSASEADDDEEPDSDDDIEKNVPQRGQRLMR